jgi:predicted transport protein
MDVYEALNEYFGIKQDYEHEIDAYKKAVNKQKKLSNKDKRKKYMAFKPRCVNCKKPKGSIFKTTYFGQTMETNPYREFSATCGNIANPCNLNIVIQIGSTEQLPDMLEHIENQIKEEKMLIIDDKNKLLFGYITTENALENFEEIKETIGFYNSIYELYLEEYYKIIENDDKNKELTQLISQTYIHIDEIKKQIEIMNRTNNLQIAEQVVATYTNVLKPMMDTIQMLKYNENYVWLNSDSGTYQLIQNKYSIEKLSYTSFTNKIVSFTIGERSIDFNPNAGVSEPLEVERRDEEEEEEEEKEEEEEEEE